jgi:hypothetical protein
MNAAADAASLKAAKAFAIIDLTSPGADDAVEATTNPTEAFPKPVEPVKTATATIEPAKDSATIDLTSPGAIDPVQNDPTAVDADETVSDHEEEAPAPTRKGKGRKGEFSYIPDLESTD